MGQMPQISKYAEGDGGGGRGEGVENVYGKLPNCVNSTPAAAA